MYDKNIAVMCQIMFIFTMGSWLNNDKITSMEMKEVNVCNELDIIEMG